MQQSRIVTIVTGICCLIIGALLSPHISSSEAKNLDPAPAHINNRVEIVQPKGEPVPWEEKMVVQLAMGGFDAVPIVEVQLFLDKVRDGDIDLEKVLTETGLEPGTEKFEDTLGRLTNIEYYYVTLRTTEEMHED